MNVVLSIIYPAGLKILTDIHQNLRLPFTMVLHGRGTATDRMLDLLGIESRENRIVLTVADPQKTRELIEEQRRVLYLGMPGNGLVIALPIKSIGGGKTLAYLSGDASPKYTPEATYDHELILAIANEGCTDMVMDAARAAGATGGTVIHGKGVGQENAEKVFQRLHRPGKGSGHDRGLSSPEGRHYAVHSEAGRPGFQGRSHRPLPACQRNRRPAQAGELTRQRFPLFKKGKFFAGIRCSAGKA